MFSPCGPFSLVFGRDAPPESRLDSPLEMHEVEVFKPHLSVMVLWRALPKSTGRKNLKLESWAGLTIHYKTFCRKQLLLDSAGLFPGTSCVLPFRSLVLMRSYKP